MRNSGRRHRLGIAVRSKAMPIVAILMLVLLLAAPSAKAATFTITAAIPAFNSTNIMAWQLNASAQLVGSAIRLTPAVPQANGSAFFKNRVSLANQRSFSSYFVLQFSQPSTPPADGIVFTLQTQSNDASSSGGGLGYKGIKPSVGIEFDTWKNVEDGINDPNANHVGLNVNGDVTSIITANPPGALANNTWHVWVDYNGPSHDLQVRMNTAANRAASTLVLQTTRDLASDIGADVYVGFTGGTGGAYENHDVQAFYFANDYQPIDTSTHTYNPAATSLALSATPASIKNDGTQSAVVTAVVRDTAGAVMPGQTVTFSTSLGTLSSSTAVSDSSGQASVTLTSQAIGSALIRATAVGGTYGETSVQVVNGTILVYFPVSRGCPPAPLPCLLTDK